MDMRRFLPFIAICAGLALSSAPFSARAQQDASIPAGQMNMQGSSHSDANASTQDFKEGGQRMMQGMSAPYTGNTDQDFVSHMIPHHEGAVDMAKIELRYGKDPEIRKLAKNIIEAQKEEIAGMKRWQRSHAEP